MRVNATDLQNTFGKYLSLTEKEDIVIVKNGKSVARLVHYAEPDYLLLHEEAKEYKTPRKVSYEEYLALVNSSEQRYELIDEEIYLMASPTLNHQIAVSEIAGHFHNYFKGKRCRSLTAPLDVKLFGFASKFEEDPNVVQPDVIVICDMDKVSQDNKYEGIPTLVVEVLSPSTKGKDMVVKLNLYMKSGIREYWVADLENKSIFQYSFSPERDIVSLKNIKEGDTVQSTAFERLELSINEVFAECF
ncbi:MAG TPA: prevent-host-death protein [Firmicutes bacterium]|nr:prevent-host-death protein [Bacillota bacterium]